MKDKTNMLELFVKDRYTGEIVPLTKLTRGLLHTYYINKPYSEITFNHEDCCATGLTIEELNLCVLWRKYYFETFRYSEDESDDAEILTTKERLFRAEWTDKYTAKKEEIEEILGEPQGRFTI